MQHIIKSETESAVEVVIGPWERRDFWQRFKWHMEKSSAISCARVTTDGWMWHNSDLTTGNLLSMLRVRLGEIGVKYTLNDVNAATVFSYLAAHRSQMDAFFGEAPGWRTGGDGSFVIEARRPVESFDRPEWMELFAWLQRQLETFHLALWPLIGRMPPKGETSRWDADLFMREMRAWNPACVGPAEALLDWAGRNGLATTWGRGRCCGSFAISIPSGGCNYQPVVVRSDGTFVLPFTQLRRSPFFQEPRRRLAFLERMNQLPRFDLPESAAESRTLLPLAMLGDQRICGQFLEVLGWFRDCVKSGRKD